MRLFFLLPALLLLSSCNLIDKGTSYDDERNPYIKEADQDVTASKYVEAESAYLNALQADPKLASVHESLGRLYADDLNDPVSSIYHFRRFLAMQPSSPKASEINGLIDKEGQTFASGITSGPSADDLNKLKSTTADMRSQLETTTQKLVESQQQVIDLKQQIIDLKNAPTPTPAPVAVAPGISPNQYQPRYVATATPPPMPSVEPGVIVNQSTNSMAVQAMPLNPAATGNPADPNAPNGTAPAASRTYKVVQGDSLWKIAHKMYPGDTKNGVDKIKDANSMDGKPLKIGQVLIIPG